MWQVGTRECRHTHKIKVRNYNCMSSDQLHPTTPLYTLYIQPGYRHNSIPLTSLIPRPLWGVAWE